MQAVTKTAAIVCAATAAQTLPEPAVAVTGAAYLNGNATAGVPITGSALTVTTAAPAAGQIQFTGTPAAPSETVTLSAAATAGEFLFVSYVPVGAIPSNL